MKREGRKTLEKTSFNCTANCFYWLALQDRDPRAYQVFMGNVTPTFGAPPAAFLASTPERLYVRRCERWTYLAEATCYVLMSLCLPHAVGGESLVRRWRLLVPEGRKVCPFWISTKQYKLYVSASVLTHRQPTANKHTVGMTPIIRAEWYYPHPCR